MLPLGTIHTNPNNPRVAKIQAAANLNNLILTFAPFELGKTNHTPEFLSKFPLGKIPAFTSADGSVNIVESDAIAQYVAESGPAAEQLLGSNPIQRAQIRQWIGFSANEMEASLIPLVLWRIGLAGFDSVKEETAFKGLERALGCLEKSLEGKEWLVDGEEVSLGDLSVASALVPGFLVVIDEEMRGRFPGVVGWYERVIGLEGVREAFGKKVFVEKRQGPPA
ncbi:hypothetical protein SI65_04678 [Aspergillus cristatus]|uniref:Elongation factor 1-gamma n=1 Tax=Aspergillus cristatus TaxID=573508 RepID=A0A1E3BFF8_ASPCR|nr:hypothetical protein SI65_04678 [Aspergillus cristatus]